VVEEIKIGYLHPSKYYGRKFLAHNLYLDGEPSGKFSYDFSIFIPSPDSNKSYITGEPAGLWFRITKKVKVPP